VVMEDLEEARQGDTTHLLDPGEDLGKI
jgi:hypothetical protein